MTSLFTAGTRERDASLPATTSAYSQLDADPSPHARGVRNTLDRWFARLPEHAQHSIGAAFRRPALPDHLGAFWELYVHELALRLGYEVEVDIGCEDIAARRPDFLLTRDGTSVYVEATVVLGDDAVHPSDRTRVDQLYDAIERIKVRDYLLQVRTVQVGTTTPGRRVLRPLERWLDALDYEDVLALRDTDRPRPRQTFRFDDWVVAIKASAWRRDLRGREDLGVIGEKIEGVGQIADEIDTFKQIADIGAISREIGRKAGWYGQLNAPFVIAALCAGPFVSDHDIAQGLIGPIRYTLNPRSGGSSGHYEPGGLWYGPQGLRNRRVSGVLTATALRPTGINVVEPVLWTAPDATHPITCAPPLRSFAFDHDAAVTESAATATIAELFDLA